MSVGGVGGIVRPRTARGRFRDWLGGVVRNKVTLRRRSRAEPEAVDEARLCRRVEVGEDGPQAAWVIATNVYLKGERGWRLVCHHASPGTPREIQEMVESVSVLL